MSRGCSCTHGTVSPHPTGDPWGVLPQDPGKGHARGKGGQPRAGGVSLGRPSWADPEPHHVPPRPHGAGGHRHQRGARPPPASRMEPDSHGQRWGGQQRRRPGARSWLKQAHIRRVGFWLVLGSPWPLPNVASGAPRAVARGRCLH